MIGSSTCRIRGVLLQASVRRIELSNYNFADELNLS